MKKITWLLFICYFLIFTGIGFIIYQKYLKQMLERGNTPSKIEILNQEFIYYAIENNLYRINPDLVLNEPLSDHNERIQSTGAVKAIAVSKQNNLIAYAATDQNSFSSLWQVQISSNESEKIPSTDVEVLNGYTQFLDPQFTPEEDGLAFIARDATKDSIFLKNLSENTFLNLTPQSTTRIGTYSFDQTGKKLVYCSSGVSQNTCNIIAIDSQKAVQQFNASVAQISWSKTPKIIYLDKGNIFILQEGESNPIAITNLIEPKKVVSFNLSSDTSELTYEVKDSVNSEVYISKVDGSNVIQITSGGLNLNPVISASGTRVAYLKNDGIYLADTTQKTEKKLVNLNDINNSQLLSWR